MMEKLLPFYQRYGIWVFFTGTLIFFLAVSFDQGLQSMLFAGLGLILALSDPLVCIFGRSGAVRGRGIERGLWISWGAGLLAVSFFLARNLMEVPVDQLVAGEDSFLPRLRLAFLFLFLLSYGAALVYRLMMSLSHSVEAVASTGVVEQKQSYLKGAAYSIFALVTVLVLVNYVVGNRNPSLDLSPGFYSFSDDAQTIIGSIDADVKLYAFLPEQQAVRTRADRQRQPELYRITDELRVMISNIPKANPKIDLEFLNADLQAFNTQEFGTVSNGTLIFRVLRQDAAAEKPYVERRVYVTSQKDMNKLEREVTRALLYVASPQRNLYFTASNGERYSLTRNTERAASVESLKEQLRFFNSTLYSLDTNNGWPGPIPEEATVVFILGPTVPFGPEARQAIIDYVKGGGRLFIALDPAGREDFAWLRSELGGKGYDYKTQVLTSTNLTGVAVVNTFGDHGIVEGLASGLQPLIVMPLSGSFVSAARQLTDPQVAEARALKDLTPTEFLHSPHTAFHDANRNGRRDGAETAARSILGLAYQQAGVPDGAKVVMFSGVDWLAERGLSFPVVNKNMTLASQGLFWLTESPLVAALAPKEKQSRTIQISEDAKFWLILFALLFPVVVGAGLGFSIYWFRKNRRFVEAA
ncbi:MAG: GldG family protein [bacterium]|nr:GldG family protein [bacterium]